LVDLVQLRDVGTHGDQSEFGCRRIQGGRVAAGYDDLGAFLLEAFGGRETDAAVPARDQCDFSCIAIHVHCSSG
jgi:hypothetical protein